MKPLSRPTEMQLLGDGYEVGQLPELHAIDGKAAVPIVALAFGDSRGLPQLGNKSWTRDDERVLLQRVVFVPAEQTAKVEVSTQQHMSVDSARPPEPKETRESHEPSRSIQRYDKAREPHHPGD